MIKQQIILLTLIVRVVAIAVCANDTSIVGTWYGTENESNIVTFYDNETCSAASIEALTNTSPVSYKINDADAMILTTENNETKTLEKTNDEEVAFNNQDYYYLSNNKLIISKKEYVRKLL